MNTYYSNRQKDISESTYLEGLLDDFYKENNINFGRVYNRMEQVKGIDVKFFIDGNTYLVDEKAATKYMTKQLNTYSFELLSSNNQNKAGWFNSPIMETTHYGLIYPHSKEDSVYKLDDFEYILVDKQKLKEYISNYIDLDKDIEQFKLDNKDNEEDVVKYISNNLKLRWSKHIKPEQPINIIVNKNILKELSILNKVKIF